MVTGAMDMVMSGDFGNTAFCTIKLPPFKAGAMLLEAVFTMTCPAPSALKLHRYLPSTMTRVVIDNKGNDLSEMLTGKLINKLGQRVRKLTAQEFIRHTRPKIVTMIKHAEQLAAKLEPAMIDTARNSMQSLQQSELTRLKALAEVNPNIRQDEIDQLVVETDEMQHYLASAHLKLEALRIAVITE